MPATSQAVVAHTRRFHGNDTGAAVLAWIDTLISKRPFPFTVGVPSQSRQLSREEMLSHTLTELGFVPNIALSLHQTPQQ